MCMKKIVSFVLVLSMIWVMSIPVSAAETVYENDNSVETVSVYMDASDKIDFADRMDALYEEAVSNGEIRTGSRQQIDSLMEQATFVTGSEREAVRQELSEYGVYMYDSPELIQPYSSDSGDVSVSAPIIFYESWEKTWTVTCGGHWNNNNWRDIGLTDNIGDADAFGVGYTNTFNTYRSSVVRQSAYITDSQNIKQRKTDNRSDGDGSQGFGFRLQDYVYGVSNYIGYKWYGSCTYDEAFGTYNGVATAYYIHTYGSAEIQNIQFGVSGKTAGLEVSISAENKSFIAHSTDKTFGVY